MSDLNDLASISDLLAETRLLALVIRGTENQPGLLPEIEKSRATAEAIASAVAESKTVNSDTLAVVSKLRNDINDIEDRLKSGFTAAAENLEVVDALRTICVKMARQAISESAASALADAADSVQQQISVELESIVIGKFGVKNAAELTRAWTELEEYRSKKGTDDAELARLKEKIQSYEKIDGQRNRLYLSSLAQWITTTAVIGVAAGLLIGAGGVWWLFTGGVLQG